MTTTLVTGPVRSGKSRHAEDLFSAEAEVLYVATGRPADTAGSTDPLDTEWAARLLAHRERRPASWRTLETHDLTGAVEEATVPVLVDCLGTWLTALVDDFGWDDLAAARDHVRAATARLVEVLGRARVPVVVVTNEVGWSLVATTPAGRFFQDELGRLNASVAATAQRVHLVVAGRVLDLSDAPVVPTHPRSRVLRA